MELLLQAVKYLAVAGGALVGWFAGPVIVGLLLRLAFRRQLTSGWKFLCRVGGAALVGYLIYLLPFGLGWGTGSGTGSGNGHGNQASHETKEKTLRDKAARPGEPMSVSIHLLGGRDIPDGRYYEIEQQGKKVALTLADLEKVFKAYRKAGRPIAGIEIHMDRKSIRETNEGFQKLVKLCQRYEYPVKTIKELPGRVEEKK